MAGRVQPVARQLNEQFRLAKMCQQDCSSLAGAAKVAVHQGRIDEAEFQRLRDINNAAHEADRHTDRLF